MATPHYGLDAELKAKQDAKHDSSLEKDVVDWLEAVSGETKGDQTVADWLHDGKILCAVANAVKPGSIKKVNQQTMPFKQMENITNFMNVARDIGVAESDMFGTPDLYEGKNIGSVLNMIWAFGGVVQTVCTDFTGPKLGTPHEPASANDKKRVTAAPTQNSGYSGTIEHQKTSTGKREVVGAAPAANAEVSAHGLDEDCKAKQAAKYDTHLEAEVVDWIQAVTGESKGEQPIAEWLHDGKILCKLVNCVKPGTIAKINEQKMPFKQMENITNFMNAARSMGVPESSMFGTPDLYEEKNMGSVVNCIYQFGGCVQATCAEFTGPKLGTAHTAADGDKKREGTKATSQYEAMEKAMEVERPKDHGITRGAA
eukprot:TRINITY_DN61381_c0_g1_i1.p1 TRINITY_DN61381_c0_g1~~TRINITY_DN61381_c0_g1_i1.p1  ORF type:complete len:370 (+),score=59.42 TRINITY_DN61381_c0_g1_i1:68-1177(+)